MKCEGKHTKIQIPIEDWKCPKCGKGVDEGGLCIDESYSGDPDCDQLHDDDYVRCYACRYDTTGKQLVSWYARQKDLVTCPCCRGRGAVSSKKAAAFKEQK